MAAGGKAARFSDVQIENLLLLADREAADGTGGPHFAFQPGPHGPSDPAVLETVKALAAEGWAVIDDAGPHWVCFASREGFASGAKTLARMKRAARRYLARAARWILTQPHGAIMAGILGRYPDLAVNNRIPRAALQDPGSGRMHHLLRGIASLAGILAGQDPRSDLEAMESDWWAFGNDIRWAIEHASVADGPR